MENKYSVLLDVSALDLDTAHYVRDAIVGELNHSDTLRGKIEHAKIVIVQTDPANPENHANVKTRARIGALVAADVTRRSSRADGDAPQLGEP